MNRLIALTGATVILAGCGASHPEAVASSPQTSAPSPCAALGGTTGPDRSCHARSETSTYAIDIQIPTDYPDMDPVTDYITQRRDEFLRWLEQYPVPAAGHSGLDIVGHSYRSANTRSLVLDIGTEGGVHPVTTFKAFNYDIDTKSPITFDTLFKAGANPITVLNPIVQRELDHRDASDVSTAGVGTDAYQNFAITDDAVVFFINQDGVFPHSVGPLEVPVPRDELGPLLAGSDATAPCGFGQVAITAEPPQAAVSHRAVTLTFALVPGASPCTLTGYPGVDSGAGGPLVHAERLPRGYMGGLPAGDDEPPTVTVGPSAPAHAVVEGVAVDTSGNPCPTYTDLRVTVPDTTQTVTVPTVLDVCGLEVHPVA